MEEKHKGRKTKALVYAGDMQTKYSLGKNPALNMYLVTSHDSVQKKTSSLQKIIPTRISFEELAQIIAIPPSQGTFLPFSSPSSFMATGLWKSHICYIASHPL